MPFDVSVIRDGATYSLTAGTPYKLLSAEGLAGPAVTRATLRAPAQDGDVDYGYHLEPRLITLAVGFAATSGSALDGYRDTFMEVFRPERSVSFSNPTGDPRFQAHTPLTLQVTRDDGEVRRIDCYATGPADMPLVREHRPGHLQRAVVQLVAPNPTWYGTAIISVTVQKVTAREVVYQGTYPTNPVFYFTGDVSGSDLFNTSTGVSLYFDPMPSTDADSVFTVDTLSNRAEVNGTAVFTRAWTGGKEDETIGIRDFSLEPHPVVSGGTNYIVWTDVGPPPVGTPTLIMSYRNRYLSY